MSASYFETRAHFYMPVAFLFRTIVKGLLAKVSEKKYKDMQSTTGSERKAFKNAYLVIQGEFGTHTINARHTQLNGLV